MEGLIGLTERETYPQIKDVINQARPLIFDFDFPIFDEAYRVPLENKILKTYYMREICDIPVSKWKLLLDIKLNEIMPYMNQLYKSELLAFDPFITVDYTRNFNRDRNDLENGNNTETVTTDASNTTTDNGTTNQKNRHSDTPQGKISMLENDTYMTSADVKDATVQNTRTDTGNQTSDSQGSHSKKIDTTENYLETIKGKNDSKSYPELLMQLRDSFLNIDLMVLNELNELFFMIY